MAKKKSPSKSNKKSSTKTTSKTSLPVIRKWPIESNSTHAISVIDIGAHLSKLNHRLYRQGRMYEARVIINDPTNLSSKIEVLTIADTWMNRNAYNKALETYMNATKEERKMLGNQKARWEDFRVYHGIDAPAPPRKEVNPCQISSSSMGYTAYTAGEFEISEVESEGTSTTYHFSWGPEISGVNNFFSIPAEYEKQSNTDTTPTTVETDMPYAEVVDTHDPSEYENLQEHGNLPPYNPNGGFAGSPWTLQHSLLGMDPEFRLSTPYFKVPCGLLVLITNGNLNADGQISIEIKAGDYKGVSADRMNRITLDVDDSYKVIM